ncbi:MAG TPA: co-chaperone GroES family protein [Candidatus Omnitrophota bacterium]|nr:co-chaperone GroES family protein [Candidatus Omnitrophota bacterium]HRZ14173.1 co-chaperone GroES family protein [Candidatus Omnitrophota bacterium]
MDKELILVGDRVLILPDGDQDRTDTGLYLPAGIKEKEKVQTGTIFKIGPGYPVPDPRDVDLEPWQSPEAQPRYFPLQAQEGDYCIFLRNAGIEIEFDTTKYIVVPHSAILVILRKKH